MTTSNPIPTNLTSASDSTLTVVAPRVDISESTAAVTIVVDLPGVSRECVEVRFEAGTLTVAGAVDLEACADRRLVRREFEPRRFSRTFRIGPRIDADGITAEVAAGVLTVGLPKVDAARERKIPVRTR